LDISFGRGIFDRQLLNLVVVLFFDHFLDVSASNTRGL
jgi:hypothetical protein